MRIARYLDPAGRICHGCLHPDGSLERLSGDPFTALRPVGEAAQVAKLLAPVAPPLILGIGLNYRRHARETGAALPEHPVLFMKSPAALQDPDGPIELPVTLASHQVDAEAELAVVIGRRCRNVGRAEALEAVHGYTCANDVSARDWQKLHGGGQWCRGKTCDTFAPLGPVIATAASISDPADLELRGWHNGQLVQHARTSDMIFDVPALIAFLSASTTLLPGTVILTGTPEGVGMAADPPRWLAPGDSVAVEIEGIGRLSNPVVLEGA
ncbi:MAG: fumarylacetoacetate hydrolase family protein [Synechococcaceae cyanobacterium]